MRAPGCGGLRRCEGCGVRDHGGITARQSPGRSPGAPRVSVSVRPHGAAPPAWRRLDCGALDPRCAPAGLIRPATPSHAPPSSAPLCPSLVAPSGAVLCREAVSPLPAARTAAAARAPSAKTANRISGRFRGAGPAWRCGEVLGVGIAGQALRHGRPSLGPPRSVQPGTAWYSCLLRFPRCRVPHRGQVARWPGAVQAVEARQPLALHSDTTRR